MMTIETAKANIKHSLRWHGIPPCTEALMTLIEELEKNNKYRWHDLRKNPEDLPEFVIINQFHCYSEAVEVVTENRVYDTALFMRNCVNGNCNIGKTWFAFNCNDDEDDQYGWNDITTGDVIAWRYIEPFEEEE